MKREESLLNLVCLLAAALFLALVVYNLFAAGAIISTDGLFFTVVPFVLALSFLAVPGMQIIKGRLEKRALAGGGSKSQTTSQPRIQGLARTVPALKDPKGRAMPPDVNRMVAEMRKPVSSKQ